MFFQSDLYAAAETMALSLEEHGLAPDQVQSLADLLHETTESFFSRLLPLSPDSGSDAK
jgi:hypothetical protein